MKPLVLAFSAALFAATLALAPASAQEAAKDPKAKATPEDIARLNARLEAARKAAQERLGKTQAELEEMRRNAPKLPAQ